jgi:hypothetical protein
VVEWWSGGAVERWSGGAVERWSGGGGDLGCGQRRIFGPTGHGNLAQGLPWELSLTRPALKLKVLKSRVADQICGALVPTPLQ